MYSTVRFTSHLHDGLAAVNGTKNMRLVIVQIFFFFLGLFTIFVAQITMFARELSYRTFVNVLTNLSSWKE